MEMENTDPSAPLPNRAAPIARMEREGESFKTLPLRAVFRSPEDWGKVGGCEGRAMPSLGSRGQVRSAAAAPSSAPAPAAPLAPAGTAKEIQPPGKALPEGKRALGSFYGCLYP